MNPINRAIAVLTQPKPTMATAAGEPATTSGLITGYAAILALLPAIGGLLAILLFAGAALGYIIGSTLVALVLMYLLRDLGVTLLIGVVAKALAPNFGGRPDGTNAMKLVILAATPVWIAGFLFQLLAFTGGVEWLILLAGFGFAGYLLYLGSGPMLGIPPAQSGIFAGILTIGWLVLFIVVQAVINRILFSMLIGSAMRGYGV